MRHDSDVWGYAKDLTQATRQKMFNTVTEEVETLLAHLRKRLRRMGPNGTVIHIAHSQGAIITYLAAKQLSEEEKARIEVVTFGGARAITREDFKGFKRRYGFWEGGGDLM